MSPSTSKAASWLARHAAEVAWSRVEDIAKQVGVSPATVVRAIKQSGYDGFSQLQKIVREQLPKNVAWPQRDEPADVVMPGIQGIVAAVKADLDLLEGTISPVMESLVDVLLAARRTLVVGTLMSAGLGEHLALHLELLLGHVDYVDAASGAALMRQRDLGADECVIGLTFPRYAKATRAFLTRALEGTPNIVLITDEAGPALPGARCTVRIPAHATYRYSYGVGYMTFLQILAAALTERCPDRVFANVEAADAIWAERAMLN